MIKLIFNPVVLLIFFSGYSADPLPKHWHETKGFATSIQGGIAGEVYKVTNLNSSGAGSFKDAVSKGNRLVVFEVGGVIEGGFSIASGVTVAGQTAPYPGITVIKGNVNVSGSNIVLSHISFQMGTKVVGYLDGVNLKGSNTVFDHVAVYWGKDETLSINGLSNGTLYKCIVGEALQFSGHEDGEHSKGLFVRPSEKQLSMIGNLVAHSALRNPRVDGGECFIANHVVYNWGPGWDHQGPIPKSDDDLPDCKLCFNKVISGLGGAKITLVGSVAISGLDSKAEYFLDGHNGNVNGYMNDNIIKDRQGKDLKQANTEGVHTGGSSIVKLLESPPVWPEGFEPLPAHEALYEVLRTSGPHPGNRNPQNARVVKTVADGNGEIIDSEDEVGGYPNYTPTSRKFNAIPSGAEARQAWLDSLEDEIAVDKEIDLSRLYTMVGSKDSDKLCPVTSVKQKVNFQADVFGIEIAQKNSGRKQLRASFTLSTTTRVSMKIFDLAGNQVAHQTSKNYKAGSVEMVVNVDHLPAGLYTCRFQIGNTLINHTYNCY